MAFSRRAYHEERAAIAIRDIDFDTRRLRREPCDPQRVGVLTRGAKAVGRGRAHLTAIEAGRPMHKEISRRVGRLWAALQRAEHRHDKAAENFIKSCARSPYLKR